MRPETFKDLVASGSIYDVTLVGQKGGFALQATVGNEKHLLAKREGDVRLFASVDTAVRQLLGMGVRVAKVDMTDFEAGRIRPARPDVAERSSQAAAALEHDAWFRSQVGATLARVEAGEAELVPHDQFWSDIEAFARAQAPEAPVSRRRRVGKRKRQVPADAAKVRKERKTKA
jgi:hypothetical protein